MANSGGVITAPVRLQQDVYTVLGIPIQSNGYTLSYAARNTHGKIQILSISKPTNKEGVTVDNPQTGSESQEGWFDATACYGVKKPYVMLNNAQWGGTIGGQGEVVNANFKNIIASDILYSNGSYTHTPYNWEHDSPTARCRLNDFDNYSHIPKPYPATSSASPIIAMGFSLLQYGTSALGGALTIRYSKGDAQEGSNLRGKLGMDKLFNTQLYDNKWHLGICIYAPTKAQFTGLPTNRVVPVALIAIGSSILGEYDPITGSTNMLTVNTNTVACISGSQASPSNNGFYIGEKVIIVPFLARLKGSSYVCIGLNTPYALNYSIHTIGDKKPVVGNRASISSVTVIVTRLDNSDGTYTFYIANSTDISIQCSAAGEYVTMTYPLNITPGDGSTNVNKLVDGKFSGSSDPEVDNGTRVTIGTSRRLDATNISNWSTSTIPENRPPSVVLRKTTNVFKISVGFSYWYNTTKRFNGIITIDTSVSATRYSINLS